MNATCCYGKMTPWSLLCRAFGLTFLFRNSKLFNSETFGAWDYNTARQVDIVTGCFLLIKHELWQKLGGFDPSFFMYGEEADFCLRLKRTGRKVYFYPEAQIIHIRGASVMKKSTEILQRTLTRNYRYRRKGRVAASRCSRYFRLARYV